MEIALTSTVNYQVVRKVKDLDDIANILVPPVRKITMTREVMDMTSDLLLT
jgi:hypothetical protein